MPPRIGLFGGSFNPVHNAHVELVKAMQNERPCTPLIIMPTESPPHKAPFDIPKEHRLAMVQLAFEGIANVAVSQDELIRPGPHYTIDTIHSLRSQHPNSEICLAIGADSFVNLTKWYRWEELLCLVTTCVGLRPGLTESPQIQAMEQLFQERGYQYYLLKTPLPNISSSAIRRLLEDHSDENRAEAFRLVPTAVATYLKKLNLYAKPTNHV